MSKLKFFTDEHISKVIVEQLRQRDIDVMRCQDVDMKNTDDELLLEYATEHGYALLSMDDDVLKLHSKWLQASKPHKGIFYAAMARFQGTQGIGSIVRFCGEWAILIEEGEGTLAENIYKQIHFVKP